ncbi:hypothetical protein G3A_03875 [Bacillus sp. 17376]|nr:hypothetical protein G3A_03875 [Bacillus sp. 17376]
MLKLIKKAQKGNDKASLELFQQYEQDLYRMAFIYVKNQNDALDVVQETFDVTDPQRLVGWADNVFVGKVVEMSGTSDKYGMLETQFKVEVAENIKGELQGEVTVNQQGGYEGESLILVENDQLLEEGESYLFVSGKNEEQNWHTVVPVYGDIMIESEAHKEEMLNKYKKAYQEEIPYE